MSCDDLLPRTHAQSHTQSLAARTSHAHVRFSKILIAHARARVRFWVSFLQKIAPAPLLYTSADDSKIVPESFKNSDQNSSWKNSPFCQTLALKNLAIKYLSKTYVLFRFFCVELRKKILSSLFSVKPNIKQRFNSFHRPIIVPSTQLKNYNCSLL